MTFEEWFGSLGWVPSDKWLARQAWEAGWDARDTDGEKNCVCGHTLNKHYKAQHCTDFDEPIHDQECVSITSCPCTKFEQKCND